jgi:hypothetical protein
MLITKEEAKTKGIKNISQEHLAPMVIFVKDTLVVYQVYNV